MDDACSKQRWPEITSAKAGPGATLAEPMPELTGILTELNGLHGLAFDASSALYEFITRVSGPQDEGCGAAVVVRSGAGTLGDIKRSIDDTRVRLNAILDMTRTLRSIG